MAFFTEDDFFPHPLDDDVYYEPITWREQYLRFFSNAIRNKPGWTQKILDRALFAKWLREAANGRFLANSQKVLMWEKDDVNFVYDELLNHYKPYVDGLKEQGMPIEPDLDGVWRSDNLIDEQLKQELIDAVATLENVPDDEKDWHPGSNNQVLDLVHPSLWPIVYGRSINIKDGKPITQNDINIELEEDDEVYFAKFCWLPSEFEVSLDGKETKIASYINNLSDPAQKKLFYPILEKIFTKFVPLFNHVLGDLKSNKTNLVRAAFMDRYNHDDLDVEFLLPDTHEKLWSKLLDQFERGEELTVDFKEGIEKFDEDEDEDEGKRSEYSDGRWYRIDNYDEEDENYQDLLAEYNAAPYQIRNTGILTGDRWSPPDLRKKNVRLEGKTARVIVKLANIVLTPESPVYGGGTWHVEATKNERIVSTGIYYFAQENITDSELAFRRTTEDMEDMAYSLPQDSNWTTVHNMSREGNTVQEVGGINTKENRAIAFPNILQHQVQPFELVDKTKPGYRKILVFFLCDPSEAHEIPTTKIIAPQQPEARKYMEEALREGPLGKLPEDVFRMIIEELPEVITREEAEAMRIELMQERQICVDEDEKIKGTHYSLCEH